MQIKIAKPGKGKRAKGVPAVCDREAYPLSGGMFMRDISSSDVCTFCLEAKSTNEIQGFPKAHPAISSLAVEDTAWRDREAKALQALFSARSRNFNIHLFCRVFLYSLGGKRHSVHGLTCAVGPPTNPNAHILQGCFAAGMEGKSVFIGGELAKASCINSPPIKTFGRIARRLCLCAVASSV